MKFFLCKYIFTCFQISFYQSDQLLGFLIQLNQLIKFLIVRNCKMNQIGEQDCQHKWSWSTGFLNPSEQIREAPEIRWSSGAAQSCPGSWKRFRKTQSYLTLSPLFVRYLPSLVPRSSREDLLHIYIWLLFISKIYQWHVKYSPQL